MPGSLIVQLGVNIASYLDGFDKASLRAKRFSGELQGHFSAISNALSGVLGQFGQVGSAIGNSFYQISNASSALGGSLGEVSGALGAIGIGAGVVVAAFAGATSAAVGLSVHAAETAAHLYLLHDATGLSVETLSKLSYGANLTGTNIDAVSRAVQILDTKIGQAARSAAGTQTIFKQFGISLIDPLTKAPLGIEQVLGEIGDKIRQLGPEQQTTFLARFAGGRTGANALIPIALQWEELSKGAEDAGVVLSTSQAKAALDFTQSMDKIQQTLLGVGLAIGNKLIGPLTTITDSLNAKVDTDRSSLAGWLIWLSEATFTSADFTISGLRQLSALTTKESLPDLPPNATSKQIAAAATKAEQDSSIGNRIATVRQLGQEYLQRNPLLLSDDSAIDSAGPGPVPPGTTPAIWEKSQKILAARTAKALAQPPTPKGGGNSPTLGLDEAITKIQDRIATLYTEATAEREAAKAMSEGNSTLAIRKADVEAATEVSRLLAQAVDKSGNSIQAEADIINKSAEAIREWAEEKADATAASSLSEGLQKEIEKLQEQNKAFASSSGNSFIEKETDQLSEWKVALDEAAISLRQIIKDFGAFSPEAEASARALALNTAAFQQAKQAQDTANIDDFIKKTQDQTQELQNQAAAKDALADAYARGDSQGIESASTSLEVAQATSQVQAAKAAFGDLSVQALAAESTLANLIKASSADKYRSMRDEIGKVTEDLRGQALSYDILSAAATGSISAQRDAARVAAEAAFSQKYPNATAATINTVGANALKEFDLKRAQSVQQLRLDTDINQKYYERVTLINAAKAAGGNILTLNAAMDDAQKEANKQWDDAALKVGNYQDRLVAIIDILHEQGDNLGEQIANELISSLDKVEDELAKIAVTGKGNFKEVGQSIEESFIKIGEKKAVSVVTGQLEKIPAIAKLLPKAKADGSQANPWYVIPVGGAGGFAKGAAGGIFGSATGILGTGQTPTSGQSGSSGSGGILHDIAKVLGIGGGGDSSNSDSGSDSGDSSGGGFGAIGSDLSKIGGAVAKDAVSIGKTIGSFFAKIFGGFLAGGGDVTPGKSYIVGEKGPEWFQPKSAGAIIPNGAARGGSGGGTKQYVTNINVGNVPDADSFKQSESQIYAKAYAAQGFAASRNV